MARELAHKHSNASDTVYARLWDRGGAASAHAGMIAQLVSGSTWTFYPSGSGSIDWVKVAVAMTPEFGINAYGGDFPPLPDGLYEVCYFVRAGGQPVQGDAAIQGSGGLMDWVNGAPARIPSPAEVAAAVWVNATRTLTSFGTLAADAAASVWAYAVRTLTSVAVPPATNLTADPITIVRGDTVSQNISALGSIAGNLKLWLTVKRNATDLDADAVVQVERAAGLIRLNGAAATAGQGTLVVNDATLGNVTFGLAAVASAQLEPLASYEYDIQVEQSDGNIHTLAEGTFVVQSDVTRATS